MINFYCTNCKKPLKSESARIHCADCGFELVLESGIWRDQQVKEEKDKAFYDEIYRVEKGGEWLQGLNRNKLKAILEKVSIAYARERFFKKWLKGKDNLILDLACGAGRDYFADYGEVVGIDFSFEALQVAKTRYATVLQAGVARLPFADNTFDYIVSADFFGHVINEEKDAIIKEIRRVLKPGGLTLHLIETDSANPWFKLARCEPALFQKYFVEQIGGHIGLELPNQLVERWHSNGFSVKSARPIWGLVWPIRYYADLFDNEYRQKFWQIRAMVWLSKIFSKIKLVEVGVNIMLSPVNALVNKLSPLNWGQGIFIVCMK